MDWATKREWALAEHARRAGTPAAEGERKDFRLAGIAGASWAAGLSAMMLGEPAEAAALLRRAAEEYETSWRAAPVGSWGRPIAMLRCSLIARDDEGARRGAEAALAAGAWEAGGPIAGYCAALALLIGGDDAGAGEVARRIAGEGLEPVAVAHALAALAASDGRGFEAARREVLRSFEERDAFLEDVPVADTVLVLDALARVRGLEASPLSSSLLPA